MKRQRGVQKKINLTVNEAEAIETKAKRLGLTQTDFIVVATRTFQPIKTK